jgi:hypothetical protein
LLIILSKLGSHLNKNSRLLKAIPGRIWLLIVEIFTLVSRANLDEHRKEKLEKRSLVFPTVLQSGSNSKIQDYGLKYWKQKRQSRINPAFSLLKLDIPFTS